MPEAVRVQVQARNLVAGAVADVAARWQACVGGFGQQDVVGTGDVLADCAMLGDQGFGLTFDAKRYFIDTTARWYVGNTLAIETEHKLDPWVISAGLSYRF